MTDHAEVEALRAIRAAADTLRYAVAADMTSGALTMPARSARAMAALSVALTTPPQPRHRRGRLLRALRRALDADIDTRRTRGW